MQTWKIKKKPVQKAKKVATHRWIAGIMIIATLGIFAYDFPQVRNQIATAVGLPATAEEEPFRLGLDLQGGTHLIYEANMSEIDDGDRADALEGVRDVIERRVNAFGVSEPVVQTTTTGGTYRVIVELAGVLDVNEAINQIGETPVLEFKEPGEELQRGATEEELAELKVLNEEERANAKKILARAIAGEDFTTLIEQNTLESRLESGPDGEPLAIGVHNSVTTDSQFADMAIVIRDKGVGTGKVYWNLLENEEGISIIKNLGRADVEEYQLSHILICSEGKTGCVDGRPAIEVTAELNTIRKQATPENFAELAIAYSTGPSGPGGGDLGFSPLRAYVPAFSAAAAQTPVGEISQIVETDFGFHLIHVRNKQLTPAYNIQRILLPFSDVFDIVPQVSPWTNTELSGKDLDHANVEFDPNAGTPYVALNFNSEGADLFGELTAAHIGEPIAIFLDGVPISIPTVQQAIYGGRAVITGDFTTQEARLLAQRLNAGALPVPVDLLSQQTIGPTLGAVSLTKSVYAALIGFLLVALYVMAFYRLPGVISVIALLLFAFLNLAAYRIFGVTITLAGIAGFVLSLGIAVDANVLIIERLKEELSSGRDFGSAVDEAFDRAWTAIRDGNITTLIAAGVLYWFSSSFIRGFALTLSIGVLLSMFTAITVTRSYLKVVLDARWAKKYALFGVKKS